jgi:hypothetical protein
VPQAPRGEILAAAAGVDQCAIRRLGNRIDRQVAALQVFLQRDRRGGIEREAMVAMASLALGARECVLLLGVWMQKHREVAAHRAEAARMHLIGGRADHHPVALAHRQAEQRIAHCTADQIDLQAVLGLADAHRAQIPCAGIGCISGSRRCGWPVLWYP